MMATEKGHRQTRKKKKATDKHRRTQIKRHDPYVLRSVFIGVYPWPSPVSREECQRRRRRRALAITDRELSVIAALAQIGLISGPPNG